MSVTSREYYRITLVTRTAEIVGAGFAGLTTAAALAQRGWSVRVHERAAEVRSFGAGIWIWENGLRVMNALGALAPLMDGAHPLSVWETRDDRDRVIERVHLGSTESIAFAFLRQHLHQTLLRAAISAGVDVVTSSEVVSASPAGTIQFANGTTARADLVVVADGVHSRVRDGLGIKKRVIKHKDGAIRLIVRRPPEAVEAMTIEWWSGPRRFLYSPCENDVLYFCLTMRNSDEEGRATPVRKDAWKRTFPSLEPLIDLIGDQGRWDQFETVALETWSAGRIGIVGDAAHAMTPGIAQGAGTAMMNALALAVALDLELDPATALKQWEGRERPLTEHTQKWAPRLWPLLGWPPLVGRALVHTPVLYRWMSGERMKACNHVPTGTESIDFDRESLLRTSLAGTAPKPN